MAKWGLDYASLSKNRPDLVMLSTCLRGQTGPEATFTGFGGQGAALAGIHSITGWPDRGPAGPFGAYTDFINPRLGVAALSAALLRRARTGKGEYLDLAQTEAGARFIEPEILDYTVNGVTAGRLGARSAYASPSGVFACSDGRFLAISVESADQWRCLVSAMALEEFGAPAYDSVDARRADEDAIESAIAAWCASRDAFQDAAQWLNESGVPAAAVTWPGELHDDPQLVHRGFFVTLDHPEMGPTPYDGLVTRFSETPGELRAAHCLGEHTAEVLTDLLGYSPEEIESLAIAGALT
jgi:benzylsuccinate CoA-transferase BbsF subunit